MTLLATLLVGLSFAQVNNENRAEAVQEQGFGLTLGGGGSFSTGNLEAVNLQGALSAAYRSNFEPRDDDKMPWLRSRVMLDATGSLWTLAGTTVVDQRLVTLGGTHMLTRRVGIEGGVQYQNNILLLLDARYTAAVSGRFRIVHRPRLELSAGLGAMVEREVRNVDPEGPDARLVTNPRWIGRVTWRVGIIPDGLTWLHTLYVEPRMDRFSDHLIVDYNTLEAHVNKIVSMTLDLQLRYDSLPPADLAQLDTRFTWGLRFRLAARQEAEQPHH